MKPPEHARRFRIKIRPLLTSIAFSVVLMPIALMNLPAFAGPIVHRVAGEGVVRTAYALTCLGLLVTCVLILAPERSERPADTARTGRWPFQPTRIALAFFVAMPLWMGVGSCYVQSNTAIYRVGGPPEALTRTAMRINSLGSPAVLHLRPGDDAHLFVRNSQADGIVTNLRAEGYSVKKLH